MKHILFVNCHLEKTRKKVGDSNQSYYLTIQEFSRTDE